jgi:protein TonB
LPPPPPGAKLPQYRQEPEEFLVQGAAPQRDSSFQQPAEAPPPQAQSIVRQRPAPAAVHASRPVAAATIVPEVEYAPPQAQVTQAPAAPVPVQTVGGSSLAPPPTFPPTPSPTPPERPLGGVEDARMLHSAEPIVGDAVRSLLTSPVSAVVVVTLTPAGTVAGARIERSTGYSALDNAAINAARLSTYTPAKVDGRPLGGTYRALYEFSP